MKSPAKSMILELLPEVGETFGIFLQRARLQPRKECDGTHPILGAGIAFSRDLAQAKAISEVIERCTLDPGFYLMSLRNSSPIGIQWANREFILFERNAEVQIPLIHPALASACHLTREDALQAAMAEAVEREHLVRWCRTCHKTSELLLAELDLHAGFITAVLREFLLPRRMRFLFSWCKTHRTLPALVCLALNFAKDTFYATASASPSPSEAIQKVLLDCIKMLLIEDLSVERGHPVYYDHPVDLLPISFREKMVSELPSLEISCLETDAMRLSGVEYCGFVHIAPWTAALGRHVISIVDQHTEPTPNLFTCFL